MQPTGLIDLFGVPLLSVQASLVGIGFAWIAVVAFLLVGAFGLRLFDFRPHCAREPMWFTDQRLPLILSVSIAIVEELLFRGILQSAAIGYTQPVYGIFAINLVFAVLHFRGGLTFAMSAGFFGMLASVMTLASATLMPAIVMHVGWNLLMALARRREEERLAATRSV